MMVLKRINADVCDIGEHLRMGKGPGKRPAKVLHGKGTDRRSRPGCHDLDDQCMIERGMIVTEEQVMKSCHIIFARG